MTPFRKELLCYLVMLVLLSAGLVWVRTASVKATYAYVRQETVLRKLRQEIQGARTEWMALTSPQQLHRFATKLELLPPRRGQILAYQ